MFAGAASALDLNAVDKDGDELINQEEFLDTFGPDLNVESFRFMDRNNDGFIDSNEFWRAMMTQGPISN